MVSLTQIALFVPAAALVALSPGANNLLAMQHGMRHGVTEAVIALTGRLLAFAVMLALAVEGLAAVLTRSQALFELVKWAGVAYLAYLGIRSFLTCSLGEDREQGSPVAAGRLLRARREFLTVAANPSATPRHQMAARTAKRRAFVTRPGVRSWRRRQRNGGRSSSASHLGSKMSVIVASLPRAPTRRPEFTRARTDRRSVHSATAPVNAVKRAVHPQRVPLRVSVCGTRFRGELVAQASRSAT